MAWQALFSLFVAATLGPLVAMLLYMTALNVYSVFTGLFHLHPGAVLLYFGVLTTWAAIGVLSEQLLAPAGHGIGNKVTLFVLIVTLSVMLSFWLSFTHSLPSLLAGDAAEATDSLLSAFALPF